MLDIETARAEAKGNLEKLNRMIPAELQNRENGLVEAFSRHKGNSLSKLQDLYEFMEEVYSIVSNVTPCKKGCNHCCHIQVSVSSLELEYMKKHDRKFLRKFVPTISGSSSPCPFLSKGSCSIYEIRPYFCRRHVSITATPYWCHPDRCHSITLPLLNFSEMDRVYFQLLESSSPTNRIFDIREISKELAK